MGQSIAPAPEEVHDAGEWVRAHQLQIHASRTEGQFLAVNADRGYDAHIDQAGFHLSAEQCGQTVGFGLAVRGHGRTCSPLMAWKGKASVSHGADLRFTQGALTVQYVHSAEGLRQNFLLDQRPGGDGDIRIGLDLKTALTARLNGSGGLDLIDAEGAVVMGYSGLLAWDACGKALRARMELGPSGLGGLDVIVEDRDATYPITIDPVATTYSILLVGTLSSGRFGQTVATAGDLNGDGFSDVVICAPQGAMGETGEGVVYVFYGSATGLPAAANVVLQGDQVSAVFGQSASTAGDVNGDGYSDLAIGASSWESDPAEAEEGAVFIYHGSATGISTTPAIILQPNIGAVYMGFSVACAGDVNNDGYSDLITGTPYAAFPSALEGAAFVFLGSASGLSNTYHRRLERNQNAAQFGNSVAGVGDVNGDGYSDIAVGAFRFDQTGTDDGIVCIYHGSVNGIGTVANPSPNRIITTNGNVTYLGWSVAGAGDVNGDGYSDVIIGDWRGNANTGITQSGVMLIYHGSASGVPNTPATIYSHPQANAWFGRSVSTAGDVNGDGYADVVVGATTYTNGQASEGAGYLFLGSPTGVPPSPYRTYEINHLGGNMGESVATAGDVNGDGYSDFLIGVRQYGVGGGAGLYSGGTSYLPTTPTTARYSGMTGALLGSSVANAGDINGDGYSDVIAGAPEASNGQAGEGLVYVHYGSAAGINPIPSLTLERNIANARFGHSVSSAGDINGDGYADVVVGAPAIAPGGQAFVYLGGSGGLASSPAYTLSGTAGEEYGYSVSTAGDMNSDGYSDLLIGAPGADRTEVFVGSWLGLYTPPVVILFGPAGSRFGAAVCTAGDVNGDGYSDVIIGAPMLSNPQPQEGGAYIYHGYNSYVPPVAATLIESNQGGAHLGYAVANAGDVNGDGFFDVVMGMPDFTFGEAGEGAVIISYGSPTGIPTSGATAYQGNSVGAHFGTSVAEGGDINGDGYADVLMGAPYFTNGQFEEGRISVAPGSPSGAGTLMHYEPNTSGQRLGWATAGGGDVNGDGYSDVVAGSPNAAPSFTDEGGFVVLRGNEGRAFPQLTRQYLADLTSPLSTNSLDFANNAWFGVGHRAKNPFHRTLGRLHWEVVFEGQPYSGSPITNGQGFTGIAAAWTDLGILGTELKQLVAKSPSHLRHKWRVRVEYPTTKLIDGQHFSRWYYGYASAFGDIGVLPVELIGFDAKALPETDLIEWRVAGTEEAERYVVEFSRAGTGDFREVGGPVAAARNGSTSEFSLLNEATADGITYYRLRMHGSDGATTYSDVVALVRGGVGVTLYPNPVRDRLQWPAITGTTGVRITDALGRTVLRESITVDETPALNVEGLATGSYTLTLIGTEGAILGAAPFVKD